MLAVLLAVADLAAAPLFVVGAAGALALERFGSAGLADIAGAQSVLGGAGWHGPASAVVASWVLAAALVLVCRRPGPAAVCGAVAGLLVAGPALAGGLDDAALHLVALSVGGGLAWVLAPRRTSSNRQATIAVGMAGLGLICVFGGAL